MLVLTLYNTTNYQENSNPTNTRKIILEQKFRLFGQDIICLPIVGHGKFMCDTAGDGDILE